jgi:glycosyltransferase involved in cell wall biosynthesis
MEKFCRISVVIPVFNRSRTIRYCLDSVLNQSLRPFEVIVVDDCSTDDTAQIVREYCDPLVRCVVLEKNAGAQAARNRGIREAQGDWIAFQDSDDEWAPEKLERQFESLRKTGFAPMTVIHADCWRYDHETGNKELCSLPVLDGANVYPLLLRSQAPLFPTILTSKAALEKIGLLDESVPSFQEWDTSIRLAKVCRFIHLREPQFVYHLHKGETISKDNKREIVGYQYIIDKFRDEILLYCGADTLNAHLTDNALKAMRWGFSEEASAILRKCHGRSIKVVLLTWMAKKRVDPSWYYRLVGFCRLFLADSQA